MKKYILAAAFVATATSSYAGGLSDPIVEPVMTAPVIEADAAQNSSIGPKTFIVMMALITMSAALTN